MFRLLPPSISTFQESSVDDDGVDDERVDAGGDYLVGVVVSIEGDGGV